MQRLCLRDLLLHLLPQHPCAKSDTYFSPRTYAQYVQNICMYKFQCRLVERTAGKNKDNRIEINLYKGVKRCKYIKMKYSVNLYKGTESRNMSSEDRYQRHRKPAWQLSLVSRCVLDTGKSFE